MNRLVTGALFAIVSIAGAAVPLGGADAVTVINGSFEDGIDPGGFATLYSSQPSATNITGWTVTSGNIDYIGNYWQAANGTRSIDMNGLEPGAISQTLTGLTSGHQYTVTFSLAGNPDNGPAVKTLQVTAGVGNQSYSFDITTTPSTHANMGWVRESFVFTANATTDILAFASTTTSIPPGSLPAFGPALDNVSITPSPLPAGLPLFAGGLGVIGLLARRRKRKLS
jgi:choice-of-anchor C domain-containing protein